MFIKYLKHELLNNATVYFIVCSAILLFGVVLGVAIRLNIDLLVTAASTTYILLIIFLLFVFISKMFKSITSGFLDDKGYFTFVLPMKTSHILLAKIVNAIIYYLMYIVAVGGSIGLLIAITGSYDYIYELVKMLEINFSTTEVMIGVTTTMIDLVYSIVLLIALLVLVKVYRIEKKFLVLIIGYFAVGFVTEPIFTYFYNIYYLDSVIKIALCVGLFFVSNKLIEEKLDM